MEKDDKLVKYIGIASIPDKKVLVDYSPSEKKDILSKYQTLSLTMAKKLEIVTILPTDHYTESSFKDVQGLCVVDRLIKWCFVRKNKLNIVFISNDYPERIGFQMLELVREKTEKILNSRFHPNSTNNNYDDIQMILLETCRDYNDPSNLDKIYSCNKVLTNVTSDMKLNIRNMLDSNDSLSLLDNKSEKIKSLADKFKTSSGDLFLRTNCQKLKMKIIIFSIASILLVYLVYKLLCKEDN